MENKQASGNTRSYKLPDQSLLLLYLTHFHYSVRQYSDLHCQETGSYSCMSVPVGT